MSKFFLKVISYALVASLTCEPTNYIVTSTNEMKDFVVKNRFCYRGIPHEICAP